jgi:hypothetical protein
MDHPATLARRTPVLLMRKLVVSSIDRPGFRFPQQAGWYTSLLRRPILIHRSLSGRKLVGGDGPYSKADPHSWGIGPLDLCTFPFAITNGKLPMANSH